MLRPIGAGHDWKEMQTKLYGSASKLINLIRKKETIKGTTEKGTYNYTLAQALSSLVRHGRIL